LTPPITISGDKATDRRLAALGPKFQKKIMRKAIRKAGRPVLDTAKRKADAVKDAGDFKRSIKLRGMKRSRRNKNQVGVQIISSADTYKGEGVFIGSFIEFGAPHHLAWGRGSAPLAPRPVFRPAHDENREKVVAVFRGALPRLLEEAAADTKKGAK
jgi:hypothetical protein